MDFSVFDVSLVLVLIGILEIVKRLGVVAKWLPVIALVLGGLMGVVYVAPGDIAQGVLVGVALALSATGLYSGTKNVKQGIKGE